MLPKNWETSDVQESGSKNPVVRKRTLRPDVAKNSLIRNVRFLSVFWNPDYVVLTFPFCML